MGCPDAATWPAAGYATALIEVAALADVIVYVLGQAHNDEVRRSSCLLIRASKPVVVAITKVETDADAMIEHFRRILGGLPSCQTVPPDVPVVAFTDAAGGALPIRRRRFEYRVALNQVLVQVRIGRGGADRGDAAIASPLKVRACSTARRDLAEFDGGSPCNPASSRSRNAIAASLTGEPVPAASTATANASSGCWNFSAGRLPAT